MNANSSTNRPDRPHDAPDTAASKSGEPDNARKDSSDDTAGGAARPLPEAARRALAEADERRRNAERAASASEPELGGRGGLDPARFGDWEIKGRAIDF